jgi:aquaporin Z
MHAWRQHWPEYLIEAVCLGIFMFSAAAFTTLLQHPHSPVPNWNLPPLVQRAVMGVAMGLTNIGLIYSPIGIRSGAHLNPAVTLTFVRLGRVGPADAAGYAAGQFTGGFAGIVAAVWLLRGLPADPSVNYVATVPGPAGVGIAFAAEALMAFLMMLTVLVVSSHRRLARFTGLCAGALVAIFITVEAPLSGMSLNAARSFGPALLAPSAAGLWIYFTAPILGMLLAAQTFVTAKGHARAACAKLHHSSRVRCIFCGFVPDSMTRREVAQDGAALSAIVDEQPARPA